MNINTNVDAAGLIAHMTDVEVRQFPYAYVNALNQTAFEVREFWAEKIPQVFDRPTAATINAVVYNKATKDRPVAEVGLKGSAIGDRYNVFTGGSAISPNQYLQPQVYGGARAPKRSEALLRRAGVLGADEYLVPASGMALDQFGNAPRSAIVAMLSDLQATRDEKDRSTLKSRNSRLNRGSQKKPAPRGSVYFLNRAQRGKLPRGIFQRIRSGFGDAIRLAFAIVRAPKYTPRYDVFAYAQQVWDERFPVNFRSWMDRALATARR